MSGILIQERVLGCQRRRLGSMGDRLVGPWRGTLVKIVFWHNFQTQFYISSQIKIFRIENNLLRPSFISGSILFRRVDFLVSSRFRIFESYLGFFTIRPKIKSKKIIFDDNDTCWNHEMKIWWPKILWFHDESAQIFNNGLRYDSTKKQFVSNSFL